MVIGSHNSWSYLPADNWLLRPFEFIARCQNVDIKTQYEEYGVRCFDLRVLFDNHGVVSIAHGFMKFKIDYQQLGDHLKFINDKGDCYVRLIHEVRRKSQYTEDAKKYFCTFCQYVESKYTNIKWWCGRNLYNWEFDYDFGPEPSCHEDYSSVSKPKLIDDWWPWLYAKFNNKKIIEKGTDKEILLIDFVNYGN